MTYKRFTLLAALLVAASVAVPSSALAATIDGQMIPLEGLTLRATQDTPTGFGNASGGGQNSAGGSELNELYADFDGGSLKVGLTGNIEGNFNKLWIFFDGVSGGEATLAGDNADGGFGEINNMAGLSFGGPTMDHAIRFEVGDGFYGIRYADLIDNVGGDVATGGGPGDLPLANVAGGQGVTVGWDNSNILGVDGATAATAATATTGIELDIDFATFFGTAPRGTWITAIVTNGDAGFASNQVLPGIGGGDNLGGLNGVTIGSVFVPVPEPATATLAMALALGLGLRRRSR